MYKDRRNEWRFRIKGNNGLIVATGESYTRRDNCRRALKKLMFEMYHDCRIQGYPEIDVVKGWI